MPSTTTRTRYLHVHDVSRADELRWIEEQGERFFSSVEVLWEVDFHHQSTLPDLTIGHVITHVARCADDCADILHEFRTGWIPPFERERRWPEDPGGLRPGAVVMDDIATALRRATEEVALHAAETLGNNPGADRISWDLLCEVVIHNWDLDIPVNELDPELANALLGILVAGTQDEVAWPRIAIERTAAETSMVVGVGDDPLRVRGSAEDLLAWLTGRRLRGTLSIEGAAEIPELPSWNCYREFEAI